jgi:thymidylate kinase
MAGILTGGKLLSPWVVLEGPHGCGKSSVLQELRRIGESPPFAGLEIFYRYPDIISNPKRTWATGADRDGQPPYGVVMSIAKLGFRALEWLLGYWGRVIQLKAKGYLVVFDRHSLLDLLVDPQRYRYGGPLWLVRLVVKLLPKPDLVIVLDAPVEVLLSRKQDESTQEIARLREAYLGLAQELSNGYLVNASRPLERVVADVERIILDYTTTRKAGRLEMNENE